MTKERQFQRSLVHIRTVYCGLLWKYSEIRHTLSYTEIDTYILVATEMNLLRQMKLQQVVESENYFYKLTDACAKYYSLTEQLVVDKKSSCFSEVGSL
jgi:hypothetical protein